MAWQLTERQIGGITVLDLAGTITTDADAGRLKDKINGLIQQDLGTTQRYMHLSPAALDAAIRLLEGAAENRGGIVEAPGTGA